MGGDLVACHIGRNDHFDGGSMRPIASPHKRNSLIKTGENINNGRKLATEVHRWMEKNRDGFFAVLKYVQSLKKQKKIGRVRDRVAVWCLNNGVQIGTSNYRFANPLWAGIARYMLLVDDSLNGHPIVCNDSDIDCFGLFPVSYLPQTHRKDDEVDYRII